MRALNTLVRTQAMDIREYVQGVADTEMGITTDMANAGVGSAAWCFCQMDIVKLLMECKQRVCSLVQRENSDDAYTIKCPHCGCTDIRIDAVHCHSTCISCGVTGNHEADVSTFNDKKAYNRSARHHYTALEHFSQTLCDFACIGMRTIPRHVFLFCLTVLGRGDTITSARVFATLQLNGYSAYYQHKYIICSMLRETPEFRLEGKEVSELRRLYRLLHMRIYEFQDRHKIGKRSKRGKLRVYWPMRFILARLCEIIGRRDLVVYIRGISGRGRLLAYTKYWAMLVREVDQGYDNDKGICHVQETSFPMVALGKNCTMDWV